jgi:hypothetical protein
MPEPSPHLSGVPFLPLHHHDGRFIRAAGLFAFARRDMLGGGHVVLHLELAEAINRAAGPGHPRWAWALGEGMNTLLVHVAGWRADPASGPGMTWHPQAQVILGEIAAPEDAAAAVMAQALTARA